MGGADHTIPMDRATQGVRDALDLITLRVKYVLGINATFNEVLSAAYMEKQKMAVSISRVSISRCAVS